MPMSSLNLDQYRSVRVHNVTVAIIIIIYITLMTITMLSINNVN